MRRAHKWWVSIIHFRFYCVYRSQDLRRILPLHAPLFSLISAHMRRRSYAYPPPCTAANMYAAPIYRCFHASSLSCVAACFGAFYIYSPKKLPDRLSLSLSNVDESISKGRLRFEASTNFKYSGMEPNTTSPTKTWSRSIPSMLPKI